MPSLIDLAALFGQGQQPEGGGLLDRLGAFAGNNQNALIGLGAGIAGGGNWNQAVSRGLQGYQSGQQQDIGQRNQQMTLQALQSSGFTPQQAMLAMLNPKMMESAAPALFPKREFHNADGTIFSHNPYAQNGTTVIGNVPKVQSIPDGATLGSVNAPGNIVGQPTAAPTVTPLMQGGVKLEDVSNMRKEVTSLPEVKRYGEAIPVFRSIQQSLKNPNAAGDIDFIYGIAKIFDPDSVVREGELKIAQSTGSIGEQLQGWFSRLSKGEASLTQDVRERLLEVAKTRMGELKSSVDTRLEPYNSIADRAKINRADIMPQFPAFQVNNGLSKDEFSGRFYGSDVAGIGSPGVRMTPNAANPQQGVPQAKPVPTPQAIQFLRQNVMRAPYFKSDFIERYGEDAFKKAMAGK